MAVVRSHIWMLPLECPVKRYLRGLDPIRLEPSHSCTVKEEMEVLSTERNSQTLLPLEDSRTYSLSVSGTTL